MNASNASPQDLEQQIDEIIAAYGGLIETGLVNTANG